jgi:phosphatidylglycerol:prolipoprotein diacylglycerol transferase
MLLAGIVAGVGLAMHRARHIGLDADTVLSMAVWLVVCGVIGARLFYVVYNWDEKFARAGLLEILNVPEGGLVIYGALFGAAFGVALFARKQRLPLLAIADLVAPSLMVGLALGRVGCLLNGCCYGGQSDLPWAVTFPKYSSPFESGGRHSPRYSPPYADQAMRGELHGFRLESPAGGAVVVSRVEPGTAADAAGLERGHAIQSIDGVTVESLDQAKDLVFSDFLAGRPVRLQLDTGVLVEVPAVTAPERSRPVHPAQLYSALDAALLGWLLWSYYPFRRRDGELLALLLTIHPVTRFLLEYIRVDEPDVFGTRLSISQNISIFLFVTALGLWWYVLRRPSGVVWLMDVADPPGRGGPAENQARPARSGTKPGSPPLARPNSPGRRP